MVPSTCVFKCYFLFVGNGTVSLTCLDYFRYRSNDGILQVCVEKGRHLSSLNITEGARVCVKIHLVSCLHTSGDPPSDAMGSSVTWCTHQEEELDKPVFGETFLFPVHSWSRLRSNTLQLNLFCVPTDRPEDETHKVRCLIPYNLFVY